MRRITLPPHPIPVERHLSTIKASIAEFIGAILINVLTFTLVFNKQTYLAVALLYGMINAAVCAGIGPISGGHLNPAITIGFCTTGKITPYVAIAYVTAQCFGGIVGSFILDFLSTPLNESITTTVSMTWTTTLSSTFDPEDNGIDTNNKALYDNNSTAFDKTTTPSTTNPGFLNTPEMDVNPILPQEGIDLIVAFTVEFLASFLLLLAVCGASRIGVRENEPVVPTAIFTSTTAGHLFAAAYTGAGLNPARVLGNARRYDLSQSNHLVMYWSAICLGGIVGALVSKDIIHTRVPRGEVETIET